MVVMQPVLKFTQPWPWHRRRVKGEAVHAVFGEVKQQRAEDNEHRHQRDCAGQERQRFDDDACKERRNTAMAKENEEHRTSLLSSRAWRRAYEGRRMNSTLVWRQLAWR